MAHSHHQVCHHLAVELTHLRGLLVRRSELAARFLYEMPIHFTTFSEGSVCCHHFSGVSGDGIRAEIREKLKHKCGK